MNPEITIYWREMDSGTILPIAYSLLSDGWFDQGAICLANQYSIKAVFVRALPSQHGCSS
jgi:hypothetical protein